MWKFGNFPATQILREIKCESEVSNYDFLTVAPSLKFGFREFCILSEIKFAKNQNAEPPKLSNFQFLERQKLISRKICVCVAEKV